MATRFLYGAWDREKVLVNPGPPAQLVDSNVFIDSGLAGGSSQDGRSPGLVRVSRVPISPSLTEHWRLIGWSVRLSLVYNMLQTPPHARLGVLWCGLAVDAQQSNQGGLSIAPTPIHKVAGQAQFPPDLSTFEPLWSQDDDVASVSYDATVGPLPTAAVPSLIAKTFMFPAPIDVDPGSQLQMHLVLTPGIYGWSNELICPSGSWAVIYDDGSTP